MTSSWSALVEAAAVLWEQVDAARFQELELGREPALVEIGSEPPPRRRGRSRSAPAAACRCRRCRRRNRIWPRPSPPYWQARRISNAVGNDDKDRSGGAELAGGVVAPSSRFTEAAAERVRELAAADTRTSRSFSPSGNASSPTTIRRHRRGTRRGLHRICQRSRLRRPVRARGGYGSCRFAEEAIAARPRPRATSSISAIATRASCSPASTAPASRTSPTGRCRRTRCATAATRRPRARWPACRALAAGLEPGLERGRAHAAFNLTVFGHLLGTPLARPHRPHPADRGGRRAHLSHRPRHVPHHEHAVGAPRRRPPPRAAAATCPTTIPTSAKSEEKVVRFWCEKSGIPFLGRADIGHDSANRIVPFGAF